MDTRGVVLAAIAATALLAPDSSSAFTPVAPKCNAAVKFHPRDVSVSMTSGPDDSIAASSCDELLRGQIEISRRSLVLGGAAVGASFTTGGSIPAWAAGSRKNGRGGSVKIPTWTLEGGVEFPTLALNTVGLSVEDTTRALTLAVPLGFSHVDFHPGKERDGVAAYLKSNPLRSKLFLNTKIRKPPPGTSPSDAADLARTQIDDDLAALGVDGVDMLMLRDSSDCPVIQAQWAVLEDALKQGKTRSLGVINYCESALKCVLDTAKVKPALNYYMLHVGMSRDPRGLRSYGESRGVRTFAYGALGEPGPLEGITNNPTLAKIGEAHGGKSPEEVALRWTLQTGAAASVRPTSVFGLGASQCEEDGGAKRCADGLKKRAGIFDWSLTDSEMRELDLLTGPGLDQNPTLFSSAGCPDAFVLSAKK